jgi:hypothetical protein
MQSMPTTARFRDGRGARGNVPARFSRDIAAETANSTNECNTETLFNTPEGVFGYFTI